MVNGEVDTKRRFVVAYFLSDDTILVTQDREINSGREGGRFMSRARVKKPAEEQEGHLFLCILWEQK